MSKSTKTTLLIAVLAILGAVAISARADELAELDAAVSTAEVELDQALTEIDELTRKLTRATIRLDQARRDLRQAEHERGLYTDGDSSRLRTVPPIVPPARVELAPLPGDLIMGPSRKEAERAAGRAYILERSRELQSLEPAVVRIPVPTGVSPSLPQTREPLMHDLEMGEARGPDQTRHDLDNVPPPSIRDPLPEDEDE